jgi:hypothetical protein
MFYRVLFCRHSHDFTHIHEEILIVMKVQSFHSMNSEYEEERVSREDGGEVHLCLLFHMKGKCLFPLVLGVLLLTANKSVIDRVAGNVWSRHHLQSSRCWTLCCSA